MDMFSPERVAKIAAKYGLIAWDFLDLLTGWDLPVKAQQMKVWESVERDEPEVIIGSPPCTLFIALQNINWAKHSWGSDAERQVLG